MRVREKRTRAGGGLHDAGEFGNQHILIIGECNRQFDRRFALKLVEAANRARIRGEFRREAYFLECVRKLRSRGDSES